MLKRMELFATNRPIDVIHYWNKSGDLNLNPPYQRGDVWGPTRRRNLIRSILIGVPIPSLIVNERYKAKWPGDDSIAVIDGKQRMTAILMFMGDQFAVPREWFEDGEGEVRFSELELVNQRRFRNCTIAIAEGTLPNIEAEIEVFELVNFGGVPQGEID